MRFYLVIRVRFKTPFVLTPLRFCRQDDQISLTPNFVQRSRCIVYAVYHTVFIYYLIGVCVTELCIGNPLRSVIVGTQGRVH